MARDIHAHAPSEWGHRLGVGGIELVPVEVAASFGTAVVQETFRHNKVRTLPPIVAFKAPACFTGSSCANNDEDALNTPSFPSPFLTLCPVPLEVADREVNKTTMDALLCESTLAMEAHKKHDGRTASYLPYCQLGDVPVLHIASHINATAVFQVLAMAQTRIWGVQSILAVIGTGGP
eukprot:1095804-Pyramimonas_sp.AAC.1